MKDGELTLSEMVDLSERVMARFSQTFGVEIIEKISAKVIKHFSERLCAVEEHARFAVRNQCPVCSKHRGTLKLIKQLKEQIGKIET